MYQINGDMDINGAFESIREELLVKQEIQDSEISVIKNEFENESIDFYSGNYFHNCEINKNENISCESDGNGNQLIVKLEDSNCSVNIHGSCSNSKTYKFKCKFCLCITNSLLSHFSREHKDEEVIYICKFCDFETKYMGNLKEHENSKHEKENYHLCHICGFKALYRSNLNRHIRHVHLKYDNSNMEFNERYVCIYCAFVTKRKEVLKAHMNSLHTLVNIFPCKFCNYVATRNDSLKKHIHSIHKENKPCSYKCEKCNYKTDRLDFYKLHFRKEHEGIKIFCCKICDYKATFSYNLKRHIMRKH